MLTWSHCLSLPSKIPMRAASSRRGNGILLTPGEALNGAALQLCPRSGLTLHKAQIRRKKKLLCINRSVSSSREGVTSAGIRQCARKAICWEGAMRPTSRGCSLLFATLLLSSLDRFQTTASHWPPLHSSSKTPSLPVLSNTLHVFPAQRFAFIGSGGQTPTDRAVPHPVLPTVTTSGTSRLRGQARGQRCRETGDHAAAPPSLPLSS